MTVERRRWALWSAVALLGVAAPLTGWLAERRPLAPDLRQLEELLVTSGADAGPGSLRQALFAAARADRRVHLVLMVPRVRLETPLPPLINPHGVVLEGGPKGALIDASRLASGPVLELRAPGSTVRRLTIEGAPEAGLLVVAQGVRLAAVELRGCTVGVEAAAAAGTLAIEGSHFAGNGFGVRLGGGSAAIRDNRFEGHREAAVWAVEARLGTAPVEVLDNRFDDDRLAVVLGNVHATVAGNQIEGSHEAGVLVLGRGVVVRSNRIHRAQRVGVFASGADTPRIVDNEIDRAGAVGVLVQGTAGGVVEGNRCHANGYGIAVVLGLPGQPTLVERNLLLAQRADALYVVGASPVIRANRVLGSGGAGLRLLDYVKLSGERVVAEPLTEGNQLEQNAQNAPQRGTYREPPAPAEERPEEPV